MPMEELTNQLTTLKDIVPLFKDVCAGGDVLSKEVFFEGLIKTEKGLVRGLLTADLTTGLITGVKLGEKNLHNFPGTVYRFSDNYQLEAGDINAHAHPEQSLYTDIVDKSWDLSTWCRNTIYKYTPNLRPEHIYLGCLRAFGRMLCNGITTAMVSFYCHQNQGNACDKMVIKAALDTGIRLYFGRINYDIINSDAYSEKLNSQKLYFESVDLAEENFLKLQEEVKSPCVIITPAVHSIHASSREAIIKSINLGEKYNKYVQFHLSEDKNDVQLALNWYKLRPVQFLANLRDSGMVNSLEHIFLSDCIWINDEERELIKSYNMKVVLNPRMNKQMNVGEADLPALLANQIELYLGTDGEASNDDLSISGERHFLKSRFKSVASEIIDNLGSSPIKFGQGYIGRLHPGHFCDLKIIRIKDNRVTDVYVGGQKVIINGELTKTVSEKNIEVLIKEWHQRL